MLQKCSELERDGYRFRTVFYPVYELYLSQLTEEQWRNITSDEIDSSTHMLLTDMIMAVIQTATTGVLYFKYKFLTRTVRLHNMVYVLTEHFHHIIGVKPTSYTSTVQYNSANWP